LSGAYRCNTSKNVIVKQLLREFELAKLLGVSPRTLREWRTRRLVPFLKINRVILFDPERVQGALKKFERMEVAEK
jgi:hypothetical protein